jgi:DNA-binding NarL/FixJ family response regulator
MTYVVEHTTATQVPVTSVLLVDDHSLITQGLSLTLRSEGLATHVAIEPDLELVLALARVHRPALALVDLQFDGNASEGLDLIEPLTQTTPVLVLTGVTDPVLLGTCLERGAIGIASKAEPFDRLLDRIQSALRGDAALGIREREDLLAVARQHRIEEARRLAAFSSLSTRECEVLDHLARGLGADLIAERTFVSVATVRTHIQAILRKLDVNSQLAAVARAHEAGWRPSASR